MKLINILIALCLLMYLDSYGQTVLPPDEFSVKLNTVKNAQLVDVRTPGEYKDGHLAKAVNIDYKNADFAENVNKLDKNKPVFVYCLAGVRSAAAAKILHDKGFTEIYDMAGGYMKWTAAGKTVESASDANASSGMSSADFQKVVRSQKVVLVDFYAPWCAPCVQMLPTIKKLTAEYKSKAGIETILYDQNKAIAKELGIDEIPAFLIYKNGKLIQRKNGLMTEAQFRKLLDENL